MHGKIIKLKRETPSLRSKMGMTLVEIILAMAILGIISILMTPVMVSAFRMITLSGSRHDVAKNVAGVMENKLAGDTVASTLGSIQINLPGGITIPGQKFLLNDGSGVQYVDLNGYLINEMTPAVPTPSPVTPTPSPTPSIPPSPTPTLPAGVTPTPSPTPAPTAAPISLDNVNVSVADWRITNRVGYIFGTSSAMEYRILNSDSSPYLNWTTCTGNGNRNTSMTISFSDFDANKKSYTVMVRQKTNPSVSRTFYVRAAPIVRYKYEGTVTQGNQTHTKTSFEICPDPVTGVFRSIVTDDKIEMIKKNNGSWEPVVTGEIITDIDTQYIYARFAASNTPIIGGGTIDDPPSFPVKVD